MRRVTPLLVLLLLLFAMPPLLEAAFRPSGTIHDEDRIEYSSIRIMYVKNAFGRRTPRVTGWLLNRTADSIHLDEDLIFFDEEDQPLARSRVEKELPPGKKVFFSRLLRRSDRHKEDHPERSFVRDAANASRTSWEPEKRNDLPQKGMQQI